MACEFLPVKQWDQVAPRLVKRGTTVAACAVSCCIRCSCMSKVSTLDVTRSFEQLKTRHNQKSVHHTCSACSDLLYQHPFYNSIYNTPSITAFVSMTFIPSQSSMQILCSTSLCAFPIPSVWAECKLDLSNPNPAGIQHRRPVRSSPRPLKLLEFQYVSTRWANFFVCNSWNWFCDKLCYEKGQHSGMRSCRTSRTHLLWNHPCSHNSIRRINAFRMFLWMDVTPSQRKVSHPLLLFPWVEHAASSAPFGIVWIANASLVGRNISWHPAACVDAAVTVLFSWLHREIASLLKMNAYMVSTFCKVCIAVS